MFVLYYVVMSGNLMITSINYIYLSKDRQVHNTKGEHTHIRLD